MVIRSVTLSRVRNHAHSTIECAPALTIISGANGAGKTSVLEAISICALAKTFVPVPDVAVIQQNAESCTATVNAVTDLDVPYTVQVELRKGVRKKITANHSSNLTPKDLIGEMPVVALSPDHKSITLGGPAERRAFLDAVMAQASKRYTELLYELKRVLKQRNMLLDDVRSNGFSPVMREQYGVWTSMLVDISANIICRRYEFVKELHGLVQSYHTSVSGGVETVVTKYVPDGIELDDDEKPELADVRFRLENLAATLESVERSRGTTAFGPQKDEILFLINGMVVRESASQGQHKTLLVALKLAECVLLSNTLRERPIVLLDDVFAELDAERCLHVMSEVVNMDMQCFVTTTNAADILKLIDESASSDTKLYSLRNSNEVCVRFIGEKEAV